MRASIDEVILLMELAVLLANLFALGATLKLYTEFAKQNMQIGRKP